MTRSHLMSRRAVCGLIGLAVLPGAARAADTDAQLAANPDLAAVARKDPALARSMLAEINQRLAGPAKPGTRSGGAPDPMLDHNPLLNQMFAHDPGAALDMLRRIKEAAGR
jgi:hypothetical protein